MREYVLPPKGKALSIQIGHWALASSSRKTNWVEAQEDEASDDREKGISVIKKQRMRDEERVDMIFPLPFFILLFLYFLSRSLALCCAPQSDFGVMTNANSILACGDWGAARGLENVNPLPVMAGDAHWIVLNLNLVTSNDL